MFLTIFRWELPFAEVENHIVETINVLRTPGNAPTEIALPQLRPFSHTFKTIL